MKTLVTSFIVLLFAAVFSLTIAGLWSKKMADAMDAARIDNANYFLYTWIIAFIICSVAAAVVLIKIITFKRRQQYEHDHD